MQDDEKFLDTTFQCKSFANRINVNYGNVWNVIMAMMHALIYVGEPLQDTSSSRYVYLTVLRC